METEENSLALVPVNYVPPNTIQEEEKQIQNAKDASNPVQYNIRIDSPYVGLANIGSTCYMNSVLQSLFMTSDFRKNIFLFRYNQEIHVSQEDCIPFQLQKLLAKMQLQFHKYIDTKDLIKSFGWNQHEAFDQHDCQEFIRILFDAITTTLLGSPNENFISDLYQGLLINYVQCLECKYESIKQEAFLDLGLTVKNIYDKVYNDSIEKALQVYLKPELLEGNNQYFCENCQCKRNAKRGTRIAKLPKILSFIINRFTFDYFTMKRIKLDDFVSFPFVLNMNDYMNGYDGIKNKLNEQVDPNYFTNDNPIKSNTSTKSNTNSSNRSSTSSNITNKKTSKTRPSNQTKDFLKNMKKGVKAPTDNQIDIIIYTKELNQQDNVIPDVIIDSEKSQQQQPTQFLDELKQKLQENKDKIVPEQDKNNIQQQPPNLQQLLQDSGLLGFQVNNNQSNQSQLPQQDQQNKPIQMDIEQQNQQQQSENQQCQIKVDQQNVNENKIKQEEQVDKFSIQQIKANLKEKKEIKLMTEEERKQLIEDQKKKLLDHLQKHEKEVQEQQTKYLAEGQNVFVLQSILLHSGGAYGGHYFAFIKSFEDNQWHIFNDANIFQLDVNDIPTRAYGGNSTSAYMLFYRLVEPEENTLKQVSNDLIPDYMQELIKQEKLQFEEKLQQIDEKSKIQQVRIFYSLQQKLIQVKSSDTLNELFENVIKEFNIKEKRQNIRLRAYKQHTDTLLDTYTGRENQTLEQLKIGNFKNLCVQIKTDDDIFEEFDATSTYIRVALWNPNIESLEEKYLQLTKVNLQREFTLQQIVQAVAQVTKLPESQLVLIQRQQKTHGIGYFFVLNCESNQNKTLDDLDIVEGTILFAEQRVNEEDLLKWPIEFENEDHRVVVRFNSPLIENDTSLVENSSILNQEFPHSLIIDNRKSIVDLKTRICQQINLPAENIVLRRSGRQGVELKESTKSTIDSLGFINGSSVYLEFGLPAKEGELRIIFYLLQQTDPQNDVQFHSMQEIGEVPISGDMTGNQLKEFVAKYLTKMKGLELNPKLLRLREKISNRVARIYRDKPIKDQQVIDKREIAIEVLDHEENLGMKDQQIYVRYWNTDTWELSDRIEIIIKQTEYGIDLGMKLASLNCDIPVEKMQACRIQAIWNFNRYDLLDQEWHNLNSQNFQLACQPFFIKNDGYLLIIKDGTKQPRELTEEEIQKLGVIITQHSKSSTGGAYKKAGVGFVHKEKTLQIKIKQKESKKEEEVQQQQQQNKDSEQQVQPEQAPKENQEKDKDQEAIKQQQQEDKGLKN